RGRARQGSPLRLLWKGHARGTPFDFGTAGVPVPSLFYFNNRGGMAAGISDGMALAPPFAWTAGGAYPGGTGSADVSGTPFCSSSLAPGSTCVISVTYTPPATTPTSATGRVTLNFTDTYLPTATRALQGTATQRALVTVDDGEGFFACNDERAS